MKLIKTELGQAAFKARSPLFSARQRTAFIMFDGIKTVDQVMAGAAGLGLTQEDVAYMLAQGFVAPMGAGGQAVAPAAATTASATTTSVIPTTPSVGTESTLETVTTRPVRSAQERYSDAKPFATKITANLGFRGFRLNMAVESAAGYDDLVALLPKIREAAGGPACAELERALMQ